MLRLTMTNSLRTVILLAAAGLPFNSASTYAQLPTPDLVRLNPPAVQAGQTANVALYGSGLEELTELRFTHDGIRAERVTKPPAEFFTRPQPAGSSFTVTVAKNTPPGTYEARAVSYLGISTARAFVVAPADSREVPEQGNHATRDSAMSIEVNSVISGSVASRGIDWYRFRTKAGQRVLLEIHAERIDSRLDGLLIAYDTEGRELSRNRDTYGRDPFLEVGDEVDREYFLAVSDILYRGGDEYFYRLKISDRPHIDLIDPPAGEPGSTGTYTLYGRNLPDSRLSESVEISGHRLESVQVKITLPEVASTPETFHPGQPRQGMLRGFDYRYRDSNVIRVGFATAPVVPELTGQDMQRVDVPCEISAGFDRTNDEDVFRFRTQKDRIYCVEAIADRMGSPVDVYLVLHKVTTAPDGAEALTAVTDNDDMPSFFRIDGKNSINPDTSDAAVVFTSDHDGDYQVTVVNQFGSGGVTARYRLAIRQPVPDFDLLATFERPLPTGRTGYSVTPTLRRGATAGIRIVAPRQDGFDGDIVITAEDLPPGVTATPLTLTGRTDRGLLVLSAGPDADSWAGRICIIGRAQADGQELVREARFAALVWGHIFADSIRVRSRLTQWIPLGVNEHEQAPVRLEAVDRTARTVEVGGTLELPVKVTDNGTRVGTLTVEPHGLSGLHRGAPSVNIAQDTSEGLLKINFTKSGNFDVAPGRYQFVLHGTGVTKYRKNTAAVQRAKAEVMRIAKLAAELKTAAAAAGEAVKAARAVLEQARQKAAGGPPEAGTQRETRIRQAESALQAATAEFQAASSAVNRIKAAQAATEKALQAAEKAAQAKNTSFAVWSDQVTVNVVPAAK